MMTLPLEAVAAVVVPLAGAVGVLWRQLVTERKEHERAVAIWQDRWIREVRRTAQLAMAPQSPTVPPPDWDEDTEVRTMRAGLVDEELRRYVEESSRPKPTPLRRR